MREQEELLQHLQSCSHCYQLVQEAMEVSAMLASTSAEADPPVTLKVRVLVSLQLQHFTQRPNITII